MRRYGGDRAECLPLSWQMTGSAPGHRPCWHRFIESAGFELKAIQYYIHKAEVRKREATERRQSIAVRWRTRSQKKEEKNKGERRDYVIIK